jgi:hypothetical protein
MSRIDSYRDEAEKKKLNQGSDSRMTIDEMTLKSLLSREEDKNS